MSMRVACIQLCSTKDSRVNFEQMSALVEQAAGDGAQYIQSPEMTSFMARNRKELMTHVRRQEDDLFLQKAQALADRLSVWLHLGSLAILLENGQVANRSFVLSPDGHIASYYDKIHMFDVDLENGESWRESSSYQAGERAVCADIDGVLFGLSICYDVRFAGLYRDLAQGGAHVLCMPAAFTQQTGQAHWSLLLRARAIECGAFVIAAAQGGIHEDGRATYGHTMIVSPWGDVLGELDHDKPDVLLVDIDFSLVGQVRKQIPALKHDRSYVLAKGGSS